MFLGDLIPAARIARQVQMQIPARSGKRPVILHHASPLPQRLLELPIAGLRHSPAHVPHETTVRDQHSVLALDDFKGSLPCDDF